MGSQVLSPEHGSPNNAIMKRNYWKWTYLNSICNFRVRCGHGDFDWVISVSKYVTNLWLDIDIVFQLDSPWSLKSTFPTLAESQFRPYPISYLFAWQQLSRGEFYGTCTHFINPEGLVSDVSVDCWSLMGRENICTNGVNLNPMTAGASRNPPHSARGQNKLGGWRVTGWHFSSAFLGNDSCGYVAIPFRKLQISMALLRLAWNTSAKVLKMMSANRHLHIFKLM